VSSYYTSFNSYIEHESNTFGPSLGLTVHSFWSLSVTLLLTNIAIGPPSSKGNTLTEGPSAVVWESVGVAHINTGRHWQGLCCDFLQPSLLRMANLPSLSDSVATFPIPLPVTTGLVMVNRLNTIVSSRRAGRPSTERARPQQPRESRHSSSTLFGWGYTWAVFQGTTRYPPLFLNYVLCCQEVWLFPVT
jgi:hypothetical protein